MKKDTLFAMHCRTAELLRKEAVDKALLIELGGFASAKFGR